MESISRRSFLRGSAADYAGVTPDQRVRRDLLRRATEEQGFMVYPLQWRRFDCKDWRQYRVLDIPFRDIR